MLDELSQIYAQVFGSEEADTFELIPEVTGALLFTGWLSASEQVGVLRSIDEEAWFSDAANDQVMLFGSLPFWALSLTKRLPMDLLPDQEPCRQLTVNRYQSGEVLKPHIDLLRFKDGIFILSLEAVVTMHFEKEDKHQSCTLAPGDLLCLCGEARYQWKHGIDTIAQQQTSLTFRRLEQPDAPS